MNTLFRLESLKSDIPVVDAFCRGSKFNNNPTWPRSLRKWPLWLIVMIDCSKTSTNLLLNKKRDTLGRLHGFELDFFPMVLVVGKQHISSKLKHTFYTQKMKINPVKFYRSCWSESMWTGETYFAYNLGHLLCSTSAIAELSLHTEP